MPACWLLRGMAMSVAAVGEFIEAVVVVGKIGRMKANSTKAWLLHLRRTARREEDSGEARFTGRWGNPVPPGKG